MPGTALHRMVSCGVVAMAMALGFTISWKNPVFFRTSQPTDIAQSQESSVCVFGPSAASDATDAINFVQEPLGRTSYRPDFSRGIRRVNQRDNSAMLMSFAEVVDNARRSTVMLTDSKGVQLALGAIVGSNGWIVTKATQLPPTGTTIARLFDGAEYVTQVVQRVADVDLALLRIERTDLPTIQWADASIPQRGSWLATTDLKQLPSAVGVVSAGAQQVSPAKAVLGVSLQNTASGVTVLNVLRGTGADEAGLMIGDIILELNGARVSSEDEFKGLISPRGRFSDLTKPSGSRTTLRGGDIVRLTISRAERVFDVHARLMDLSSELHEETEMEVNGRISARATGFNRVFTHDTVLDPNQCGGPLCNLDGQVVGLNIARAGRVSSYALPADIARPLIEQLINQATLVSRPMSAPQADAVR